MTPKPVKYLVVDAFTDSAFKGNPIAVCLMEEEREQKWLQALAAEFSFSITCYLTRAAEPESDDSVSGNTAPAFRLRWFSPLTEVELCGPATMAAAHTLFSSNLVDSNFIEFSTLSGTLSATRISEDNKPGPSNTIELDFPVIPSLELNSADDISTVSKALNLASIIDIKITTTNIVLVVLPCGKDVEEFEPNLSEIQKCPGQGIIITGIPAAESEFDFYSRTFLPKFGVNEDPVCGSAHCALAAYWAQKLGKSDFVAYAASRRSGIVHIHVDEQRQRVLLRGKAISTMEGIILV